MKFLKNLFKSEPKKEFSSFFRTASLEEKRKLMETVARGANADQRALLEQYEKAHGKTA